MRKLVLRVTITVLWVLTAAASANAQVLTGDQSLASYADSNSAGVAQASQYTAVSPASAQAKRTSNAPTVLVGDQSSAPSADSNGAGIAQAFTYQATASGTTTDIELYVNSGTTATKLTLGLYGNANGKPGSLLASGSIASPKAGAWNEVSVGSVSVTAGSTYWIALLATGGQVDYPDTWGSSGDSYVESATGLTALPAKYSSGNEFNASPASAYVMGLTGSSSAPAAPTNTAAPAISGQTVQGQTLSTSNGSWNGSPTSYAYQWQRCSGSCSNISGATSSTYTLQSADVGDKIDVVVTATNAGGSTPATSAATSVVTAPAPPAPSNTAAPAISGQTVQGQTLTTANGSWSGSPTSYAYQWQDCSSSCANISGATSSTYTLRAADVGDKIDAVVTASNAGGSKSAAAAQVGPATSSGGGASYAPTYVQSNATLNSMGSGVTNGSVAFASSVTSGDLIVVSLGYRGAPQAPTLKDTLGTTFDEAGTPTNTTQSTGPYTGAIYWGVAPSGGADTVTATSPARPRTSRSMATSTMRRTRSWTLPRRAVGPARRSPAARLPRITAAS